MLPKMQNDGSIRCDTCNELAMYELCDDPAFGIMPWDKASGTARDLTCQRLCEHHAKMFYPEEFGTYTYEVVDDLVGEKYDDEPNNPGVDL